MDNNKDLLNGVNPETKCLMEVLCPLCLREDRLVDKETKDTTIKETIA